LTVAGRWHREQTLPHRRPGAASGCAAVRNDGEMIIATPHRDDFLRALRNTTAQRVAHIAQSGADRARDGGRRAMLGARHGIR